MEFNRSEVIATQNKLHTIHGGKKVEKKEKDIDQ